VGSHSFGWKRGVPVREIDNARIDQMREYQFRIVIKLTSRQVYIIDKTFLPQIKAIPYEGSGSSNPLAFLLRHPQCPLLVERNTMGLDIRFPIGMMFSLLGGIMTIYGFFTGSNTEMYRSSLGLNFNF
jgi:hypothetical protein